jgi:hypothetical protein
VHGRTRLLVRSATSNLVRSSAQSRTKAAAFALLTSLAVLAMVAFAAHRFRARLADVSGPDAAGARRTDPRPTEPRAPRRAAVPVDAAVFALPYHTAVVRLESPDAVEVCRFDVVAAPSPTSLVFDVTEQSDALPERTRVSFTANALGDAHGVLTIAQTNDVHHEDDAERSWDGRVTRSLGLDDTTPPFLPSRRLLGEATAGEVDRLWFGASPAPMPRLVRDGETEVTVTVRGRATFLVAERYASRKEAWPDRAELLLVRRVEGLGDVAVVVSVARDDEWRATLLSLD